MTEERAHREAGSGGEHQGARSAIPGTGLGGGRYRVLYRVDQPYESTGHSDLIRRLYAAFKDAMLPVATSGVKNPRPKVAFGPPLPTGCMSDGEYFDIELEQGVEDLPGKLNATLPEGLRVVSAERIDAKAATLSAMADSAEYALFIPEGVLSSDVAWGCLAQFEGEGNWQVQRASPKGTGRTINLKRAVVRWVHEAADGGSRTRITLRLNDPDGQNANPTLILSGLFRLPEEHAALVRRRRVEFYDSNGQPLSRANWRRTRNRSVHSKSLEFLRYLDR